MTCLACLLEMCARRRASTEHLGCHCSQNRHSSTAAPHNHAYPDIALHWKCPVLLKLLFLSSYFHINVQSKPQRLTPLSLVISIAPAPALHAARLQAGAGGCYIPHTGQAAAPGQGHAGASQPTRRSVDSTELGTAFTRADHGHSTHQHEARQSEPGMLHLALGLSVCHMQLPD